MAGAQLCRVEGKVNSMPAAPAFARAAVARGAVIRTNTEVHGLEWSNPAQVRATEPVAPMVHNLVYFAGGKLTFKQAKAGTLLISGGWASDIDPGRTLSGRVRFIRTRAGKGLATPDLGPIIGPLDPPGLVAGVYPHVGLTAGPLMGRVLAQLALDLPCEVDLKPFAPDRF